MAITTSMIKELRDATSMGINDCKKALEETNGDFDAAVKILREKGAAIATKRASKDANEGMIAAHVSANARSAALIEVNCEPTSSPAMKRSRHSSKNFARTH